MAEPNVQDDHVSAPTSSEPEKSEPDVNSGPTIFGIPALTFVRGGTTSGRHDKAMAEHQEDAERRRNVADMERRIASIPIEDGGGTNYANPLAAGPSSPKVLLEYLTPSQELIAHKGEPLQCISEITMVGPDELALTIVCPACLERGLPEDQCQLLIRQSNKNWTLDSSTAGTPVKYRDPWTGQWNVLINAGTVMESEKFTCAKCTWTARIDRNRVIPD